MSAANPRKIILKSGEGRWEARYRDTAGRHRSRTFHYKRDAVAFLEETRRELRRGEWIDPADGTITLLELAEDWIDRSDVPNTIAGRITFSRNLGDFGGIEVGKLTPRHMRQWEKQLRTGRPWKGGKPLSDGTVGGYVREMKAMLTAAVVDERIRKSPADVLKSRKVIRKVAPDEVLTADMANAMIDVFESGRRRMTEAEREAAQRGELAPWTSMRAVPEMGYLVRAGAAIGPRPSELLDIRLEDIDVARGTVYLRGTKSDAAPRTIGVPAEVIREMRKRAAEYPTKEGFVMMRSDGRRMTLQWIEQRFRAARAALGLPDSITPHSLRHLHATSLIAAGVDVKAVQHRLGHSSAMVTLDIYAHWWPSREGHVVEAASQVLAGFVRDLPGLRVVQ